MLYISSRSKTDSFTAHRTLCVDRAPDGGVFIPYTIPQFSAGELQQLKKGSFGQIVANILNLFFACKLTAWDVDICVGRTPVRLNEMSRRLLTAECFHNPARDYSYMETHLYSRLTEGKEEQVPTAWSKIAIRIALLFGICSLMPETVDSFDIAVNTGDFTVPMAAWYARKMGLPVRIIICSCNDSDSRWDLIQRGELNTAAAFGRSCVPDQVEGLIFHKFGTEEANALSAVCNKKGTYRLSDEALSAFGEGLAAAVVGTDRIASLIRSVYRTNSYYITDAAAVSYGALQDYRASTGESRYTLILMDTSPALRAAVIASAAGITENEVLKAF